MESWIHVVWGSLEDPGTKYSTDMNTGTDLDWPINCFADVMLFTQSKTWLNVTATFPRKSHVLENVTSATSFLDSVAPEAHKGLAFTGYP